MGIQSAITIERLLKDLRKDFRKKHKEGKLSTEAIEEIMEILNSYEGDE